MTDYKDWLHSEDASQLVENALVGLEVGADDISVLHWTDVETIWERILEVIGK